MIWIGAKIKRLLLVRHPTSQNFLQELVNNFSNYEKNRLNFSIPQH